MIGPMFFMVDFIGHDVEVDVVHIKTCPDQGLVVTQATINVGLVEVGNKELINLIPLIGPYLDKDLAGGMKGVAVTEAQEIPLTEPRGQREDAQIAKDLWVGCSHVGGDDAAH